MRRSPRQPFFSNRRTRQRRPPLVEVLDLHVHRGTDPRECVRQELNNRTLAKPHDSRDVDPVEELGRASSFPRTGGGSQKLRIIAVVAFYRLKASIRVLNLVPSSRTLNTVFQSTIQAGEIVESISAPNQNGRILVRHDGQCLPGLERRAAERLHCRAAVKVDCNIWLNRMRNCLRRTNSSTMRIT